MNADSRPEGTGKESGLFIEMANSFNLLYACRYPILVDVDKDLLSRLTKFLAMSAGRDVGAPGLGRASCEEPVL